MPGDELSSRMSNFIVRSAVMNEASLFISSDMMNAPEYPLADNLELSIAVEGQKCDSASAPGNGLRIHSIFIQSSTVTPTTLSISESLETTIKPFTMAVAAINTSASWIGVPLRFKSA